MSIVKEWAKVFYVSPNAAFGNLLGLPLYYDRNNTESWKYKGIVYKDNAVKKYLRKKYNAIIEKYRNYNSEELVEAEKIVWHFWWQGEEDISPLMKMCIESSKKAFSDYKFILITKDNYRHFFELPDYVLSKHDKGNITTTELADICRLILMANYGGIWCDVTVFFVPPITNRLEEYNIFGIRENESKLSYLPNKRMWTSFFIYSKYKNNLFYLFARDMMLAYWKDEKYLIDYFMIDYLWMIAYEEFDFVKKEVDSIPISCRNCYGLRRILSKPYDDEHFRNLTKNTWLFKLARHDTNITEIDGKETYYGYLLKGFGVKDK